MFGTARCLGLVGKVPYWILCLGADLKVWSDLDTKDKGLLSSALSRGMNRGRKHRHWKVNVYYVGGGKFVRVYTDRRRAENFAAKERRSPVVRYVRVREEL